MSEVGKLRVSEGGFKYWVIPGKHFHRKGGPAYITPMGVKQWYQKNSDGPLIWEHHQVGL